MGTKRSMVAVDSAASANADAELPAPEIIPAERYRSEVQAAVTEAQIVLADLKGWVIDKPEQANLIAGVMNAAKERWRFLEAKRKTITVPIDAAKAAVQDMFKPALVEWLAVERATKDILAAWEMQQIAVRRAAEADAEAAFAAGKPTAEVTALVAASAAPADRIAGATTRQEWIAAVADPVALLRAVLEGRAPANLVIIDDQALQAYARATKGSAELPGVRFSQRTIVAGSRR